MKQFSKDLGNVSLAPKGKWSREQEYERLALVYNACDNLSYVAKINVPSGVDIENREYWQPMNATGYADNNFINLTTESENGTVTAYESLEEAVATILPINRRAGATLSFYNLNADRLDRQAEFELWQFNSTDLANWENRDYWNNIYYNWNVFAGWYVGADGLKNHVKIPNVGQYAYVGTNLNDALLYQCRTNGTWTNTGIKVRNYISVVISGNITIGENGNWFSDGEDTGIPATPAVDEQLDNIIIQLQQHATEIDKLQRQDITLKSNIDSNFETINNKVDNIKTDTDNKIDAADANLQNQITNNDTDIANLNTKHESLSRTVQGIAATGGASTATNVTYNNDSSGLNAENAQDAIDEVDSKVSDLATKAVSFIEKKGAVSAGTGAIQENYGTYRYVEIDVSQIRKLRIKGKNTNAALGYAVFDIEGNYIKAEGDTYSLSTFSDFEITFSDEAKKLRFCYDVNVKDNQKINVIEYKNDSLIDKTNLLAKQSFTLGSIIDTINGKFINSSGVLFSNQSYGTKYFAVKKGDKVQIENYVKGNYASSPISFVLGEEVLSYTKDSLLNEDNSTGYFTAPQDCLCYVPRYNSSDSDNAIINIIHTSLVDFTEDIQKDIVQDIDLIRDNSLSLDNRYQYKVGKMLNNGILIVGNGLTFCDDTFYKAKKGEVLLFKDVYNTNINVGLISIYSDATEESYIKTLYTIKSNSTQSKQPDVRVEIPQDCYFRISTASNSQKECSLKVYRTIPLHDVVNDINVGINEFKDVYDKEKTIQVPLVAEVGRITKYYKCSDKCLIVCDDFVNNNNNLRFHTIKDDPFSIETINIRTRGHFEYIPPQDAKYFSIELTSALDSETGKVKLIVPSTFYYNEIEETKGVGVKPIVISGDSVAGNLESKFVSTLINGETAIFRKSAASEGPWSTMMRMGWAPCMVFPFTIPASNKYGVKVDILCNMHYKPTIKEDGTSEFTVTDTMTNVDFLVSIWGKTTDNKPRIVFAGFDCEINGIRGTLGTSSDAIVDEDGNFVNPDTPSKRLFTIFQRKDEGDEVVINSPVLAKPFGAETFANAYHINFMGQNRGFRDVDNDFFITDTQDTPGVDFAEVFFNMQKLCFNAAAGNYMIIGCLFKGYVENNFQKGFRGKYERLCEKEFGAKFVNLRQYMITQAHLACGRTLSQEDKDMIKTGQLPPYLGDVHLNELGRELTANLVAERCYELGWIKNKPNYYDVVATRTRLENDGTI